MLVSLAGIVYTCVVKRFFMLRRWCEMVAGWPELPPTLLEMTQY